MFNRILVVCTGNICRSPIAEGLLRQALPKVQVASAGTGAVVGAPADPHSHAVCLDHGVDVSDHRARQVTEKMLQEHDLVLALDTGHKQWLEQRYPQYRGKIHLLGKWAGDVDVLDPHRQPKEQFETCYRHIAGLVQDWAKRVPPG